MSDKPLGKLEKLAGRRADQSRDMLQRETNTLQQMDDQHRELRSINQEYQQALVGTTRTSPQLLAHRREFVSQLTMKLDQLAQQRQDKQQVVQDKAIEHHLRTAQHTAIGLVHQQRMEQIAHAAARSEQQCLDEIASIRHTTRKNANTEYDNE